MPKRTRVVIGGVDTHGRTHHAAVIDQQGRLLDDQEFPATSEGYRHLLGWLRRHGRLHAVGVEGTGSYGAGLAGYLLDQQVAVIEVDRPDRRMRRQRGKSDWARQDHMLSIVQFVHVQQGGLPTATATAKSRLVAGSGAGRRPRR